MNPPMAVVASTATCFPGQRYDQSTLAATLTRYCEIMGYAVDPELIGSMFTNALIQQRYFALSLDAFYEPPKREVVNDQILGVAVDVCAGLVRSLLDATGLQPGAIHRFMSMMTTAIAIPTLEVRVMNKLGFPGGVKRMPMNGLGCMAGAAGFARMADVLDGHPAEAGVVLSCELGGTAYWLGGLQGFLRYAFQHMADDPGVARDLVAQVVSAALFGDGAASVLMVGRDHPLASSPGRGPEIVGTRSITVPGSEGIMSVRVLDHGFMNNLSTEIPEYAGRALREAMQGLLAEHRLGLGDIEQWMIHPGGPKVLQGVQQALELPASAMALSFETLAEVGNVSAPTVLEMLHRLGTAPGRRPRAGAYSVLAGMGPGFSEEVVLLRW